MENINVKELITFEKCESKLRKSNFANKLKSRNPKIIKEDVDKSSGGNYWSISNSAIYNTFKNGKDVFYDSKINELNEKLKLCIIPKDIKIHTMYTRNSKILHNFKNYDILELRPSKILKFHSVSRNDKIINIYNFPIYINPSLVFEFESNNGIEIGALILVSQLDGFEIKYLSLFCEALYSFLENKYGKDYTISEKYCIAVDTYNSYKVSYTEIMNGISTLSLEKVLNNLINI